ncbi:hypothetical protein AURDEDRAFT_76354, partial [Auricularia subglabra TFB-10046 SS5]
MRRYIDSCHQGHLIGTTIKTQISTTKYKARSDSSYSSPLNSLPKPSSQSDNWSEDYANTVNDILTRTNHHACGDQCLDKNEICKARFPRSLISETSVDDTGYIHVRQDETRMNTVNHALSYVLRCNTDVTCLLSGTAIKAVIAYATDYITKVGLKTPSMFQLIQTQLDRSASISNGSDHRVEKGRKLVTGIINSFTSKSEIGSPMAASYILDLPDHYKSHEFKVLYWRSFVAEVLSKFDLTESMDVPGELQEAAECSDYTVAIGHTLIARNKLKIVAVSPVQDYTHRPLEHTKYCLYDWIRLYTKSKRKPQNFGSSDVQMSDMQAQYLGRGEAPSSSHRYPFMEGHSQFETHSVFLDDKKADMVPNFVGGTLPRCDTGDREYYCCTMLTLFKPWRIGTDLKSPGDSWDWTFEHHVFSDRQKQIMDNFNLRYECLDERDDYSRNRRNRGSGIN